MKMNRLSSLKTFKPSTLVGAYPPCVPKLNQHAASSRSLLSGLRPSLPISSRRVVLPSARRASSSLADLEESNSRPYSFSNAQYTETPLSLEFSKAGSSDFGTFWLRENCQCPKCIHPDTSQRISDTFSIPTDVRATDIKYQGDNVRIEWTDGHKGVYPYSWLRNHRTRNYESRPRVVSKKIRDFISLKPGKLEFPTVSYKDVMSGDKGMFDWLHNIYMYGFCFVEGVPVNPESTKALLERIAFIRHTHYGGFWDFTADLTFKDTAYTTEFLGAHTDNTYFTDPARLQLFHLLSHTDGKGGESLLVDGFRAASQLRKENAENYDVLANIRQPYHASGNDGVCIQPTEQYPVFRVHPHFQHMNQIRWNNYDRAAKIDWNTVEQRKWYNAARHFNDIITSKSSEIWTQLEPGKALIFDNWRILHGRAEYTGKRRMCGGYINNDDFLSRYRLLRFGKEKIMNNLGNYSPSLGNPNYYG